MKIYRQGDVCIFVNKGTDKEDLVEKKDKILAHGEVTGHAHRITKGEAKLFADKAIEKALDDAKELVMKVSTPSEVTHEEHEGFVLPVGAHKVVIQREYDWTAKKDRKVVD